jgi:hypothetical protein
MDTIADYDAWKSKQQQATAAAAGIVLDTVNVKPDEIAGDLQLAQEYAKTTGRPTPPLPLVQENRSIFPAADRAASELVDPVVLAHAGRMAAEA